MGRLSGWALLAFALQGALCAQKVDFARDVQPILRQNCIACHGPQVQNAGLRLDRRSSALKPGTRRITPGNIANSLLFHRLVGNEFGMQMPPTGPIRSEQTEIIRKWIEQGADWPDSLANEVELPPLEPKAIAMVEALRNADRPTFDKMVAADPKLLNARGPESSTPFMYAVLYTDGATLERLIKLGADVNRKNDAGATALMWAALNPEKTRVLLAHGADVNAKSEDFRTALMVAAGKPGNVAAVKMLLDKGANPNPGKNPSAESSPLLEASMTGDLAILQLLLAKGADAKEVGGQAIANELGAGCLKCIDILAAQGLSPLQYTVALGLIAVANNPKVVKLVLDHGADVNAVDPTGRTALMYAAVSDELPTEQIGMMLEKGAMLNVKSTHKGSGDSGLTALDIAKMHGKTPVVELLLKAGATASGASAPQPRAVAKAGNTLQAAVPASLPLLQRSDASFMPKAGCFSCHNQSLEATTVALARKNGFKVDETLAAQQLRANAGALTGARDLMHQGTLVPGLNASPVILAYVLLGLDAEGYKPDLTTDTVAMFLQSHQMADGHWAVGPEARPPLCADGIGQTVIAMRGLQLYSPKVDRGMFARSIQMAGAWVNAYPAKTTYDMAWKLRGMVWAGAGKDAIAKVRRDLLALQKADGGWSDLPSMESGAFSTGLSMIALQESGLPVSDAAYQKGVKYLLGTQLADGSWHVPTRAAGFQPYFDNGFPHGVDQWISAAGTSLATMALTLANPATVAQK